MTHQRNIIPVRQGTRSNAHHQRSAVKGGVRERYWPGTLMGLGIFFGLVSMFTVAPWTEIDHTLLFRFFLGLCFAGTLLPYMRSGLRMGMERSEWFLFNLLAVGPIGTSLLLWTNFVLHGDPWVTEHGVRSVEVGNTVVTYAFSDGYLEEHEFARSVYKDWYATAGDFVRITEANGLFGVKVVLRKEPFRSSP